MILVGITAFVKGKNSMFLITPCHELYSAQTATVFLKVRSNKSNTTSKSIFLKIYTTFQLILHYSYAYLLLALCIVALLF